MRVFPASGTGASWSQTGATAALICALCAGVAFCPASAAADASLAEQLGAVLQSRALAGARVGALVVRARDGAVLFENSADRPLTPASNMKLLTALAALSTFGPAYRFETPVLADRAPDAEGVVTTLYVRGSGDPVLNSEDWWRLASELRRTGLRSVSGDLVLDDSAFDRERWHPAWGRTSARAYHAPVGALTANYGSFAVTVTPGPAVGAPVRVDVEPMLPYLRVVNRAITVARSTRPSVVVDRRAASPPAASPSTSAKGGDQAYPHGEVVVVAGNVRVGDESRTYYRSVLDPTRYAGAVLRMQLAANGIEVGGRVRVGAVPPEATELIRFRGRPLAEIVRLFVKYSNNAIAETLVKAMGARAGSGPGTWATGMPALEQQLLSLGLDAASMSLVDGSGLARDNAVTARLLVAALTSARDSFRFGLELLSALPIAALDGTLEKRASAAAGAVRAKTGLLDRVTSLSGMARLSDGSLALFSVIVNGYRVGDAEAIQALDRFAAVLVAAPHERDAAAALDTPPAAALDTPPAAALAGGG